MIDHLGIQSDDVDAAASFYLEVFAPLGFQEIMRHPVGDSSAVGLGGSDGFPHFWIGPIEAPGRRPIHVAFIAPSRAAVDEVHARAVAAGAEILHEPRVWPEYHEQYYGVFLRDHDGNNVEAVCHAPE